MAAGHARRAVAGWAGCGTGAGGRCAAARVLGSAALATAGADQAADTCAAPTASSSASGKESSDGSGLPPLPAATASQAPSAATSCPQPRSSARWACCRVAGAGGMDRSNTTCLQHCEAVTQLGWWSKARPLTAAVTATVHKHKSCAAPATWAPPAGTVECSALPAHPAPPAPVGPPPATSQRRHLQRQLSAAPHCAGPRLSRSQSCCWTPWLGWHSRCWTANRAAPRHWLLRKVAPTPQPPPAAPAVGPWTPPAAPAAVPPAAVPSRKERQAAVQAAAQQQPAATRSC